MQKGYASVKKLLLLFMYNFTYYLLILNLNLKTMKKLQLKIQDLKNPSILSHREIKNIMGCDASEGSGGATFTCTWTTDEELNPVFTRKDVPAGTITAIAELCISTPHCISVSCNANS